MRTGQVLLGLLAAAAVGTAGSLPTAAAARGAQGAAPAQKKTVVTLDDLARQVESDGLQGTMHGARHPLGTYVFTWYHPEDFFQSRQFSLAPGSEEVARQLADLDRHQQVKLRGRFLRNGAAQPHIRVEVLTPGPKWDPGVKVSPAPEAVGDLRKSLPREGRIPAMVHALDEAGGMLVIEYADAVLPVRVPPDAALRKAVGNLYRGDRIEIAYRVAEFPRRPMHLELRPGADGERAALVVTDRIAAQHEKQRTVEGQLVLFPKSPVLSRALWGVEEKGPDGLHRYFTIFNFDDLKDQGKIETLLDGAWKGTPEGVIDGRNKYIHTGVRVRVSGLASNPSKNQANPTLVTDSTQVTLIKGGGSTGR